MKSKHFSILTSLIVVFAFLALSARAQTIANPSFEADHYFNNPGYASGNGGIITGWTISDPTRIGLNLGGTDNSGLFADNGPIPDGTNVAFIQSAGTTNSLSTTISNLVPGTIYQVTFRANCRDSGYTQPGTSWSLNGGAFVPFTCYPPVFGDPYYTNSGAFVATSDTAPLVLRNAVTNGDGTVLVDNFTIQSQTVTVGTWTNLANPYPANPQGWIRMMLLSDGTVMAHEVIDDLGTTNWYRLTPDIHGSYIHGTWAITAPMHDSRSSYSGDILRDGRLFVAGGEAGTGGNKAEVFDPVSNVWTSIPVPAGLVVTNPGPGISDAVSEILPDGRVLVGPASPVTQFGTIIFDPVANSISAGPACHGSQNESSWVKLADDSILTVDIGSSNAERYIPALNQWIPDAKTPVSLWDTNGETGASFLLPDGRAIQAGGRGHTAIYTPSGTTNLGTWTAGPDFPDGQGTADVPAAMMVNGRILFATGPVQISTPARFYEYDSAGNFFLPVTSPSGSNIFNTYESGLRMLDLPDGTVLLCVVYAKQIWVYRPGGAPLAAGQPTILSVVTTNGGTALHLTGLGFNGISEGAAYGDDEQMATAFPLVRFTDAAGNVRYGRTYNWSRASVMTGTNIVTTECTIPVGASLADTIQVVANGNASAGCSFVTNLNDGGPGSLRNALAQFTSGGLIAFAPNLSGQAIVLTNGQLEISNNIIIDGSSLAGGIRIDGNAASRIFQVDTGATVVLNALTITNGNVGADGGGILNRGNLTINRCALIGNRTGLNIYAQGGAINNTLGSVTLNDCTLSGNYAGFTGGALYNNYGQTMTLVQCTIAGNTVDGIGGGIDNNGSVTLVNTIVALNAAPSSIGADIDNYAGTVQRQGGNIIGTLRDAGGGTDSGPAAMTASPLLAPLGNYGGPTETMPPYASSPAIDAGSDSATTVLPIDQRGHPRFAGAHVDIGAVEVDPHSIVTTNTDHGAGSLRNAVAGVAPGDLVSFLPGLSGQTIVLTNGQIALSNSITIDSSSLTSPVQINGNGGSRIFYITNEVTAAFNSLIIANGHAPDSGGGVYNMGTATLNNCTVANNSAGANDGGGIFNGGTMTVVNSTVVSNIAAFYGGGIDNSFGVLTVNNSAVLDNDANSGDGGGLYNRQGTMTVNNSTVAYNSAPNGFGGFNAKGGGIYNDGFYGPVIMYLNSSTVAYNSAGNGGGGVFNDGTEGAATLNVTNTVACLNSNGDFVNNSGTVNSNANLISRADINLAPLGYYGGPTQTMPPLAGSPAINVGAATTLGTDQRGLPRVVGSAPDIGAVELQTPFQVVSTTADSGDGSLRQVVGQADVTATVTFAPGLAGQTIGITGGEIAVSNQFIIDGSALSSGVQISGSNVSRIFNIGVSGNLTLNSLTLRDANGGGGDGGAILNIGTATLNACTLTANSTGSGGAIVNNPPGVMALNNCTLTGNSSASGGGGGAIVNRALLAINNSTLADNTSSFGNAIYNDFTGVLNTTNSIFSGSGSAIANFGIIDSASNLVDTASINLAALGNYGGLTQTMPPLSGSPAIDGGADYVTNFLSTDQRGESRLAGAHVDTGAVEGLYNASGPGKIKSLSRTVDGSIQLGFTNLTDERFLVLATTNLSLGLSNWTQLGLATESPAGSGNFQFTDPQAAANFARRFYLLRFP